MSEEDDSLKTEDPTDKKLANAKKKGQVAQSMEIKSWMILLGGTAGLVFMAPFMTANIRDTIEPFIRNPHAVPADFAHLLQLVATLSVKIGLILAPLLALLFVIALFSNIVQFGLIFAPEKIKPDISKVSLISGVKRMFGPRALMEFLKGILKLLAVGIVSFSMALPMLQDLTLIPSYDLAQVMDRINIIAILLAIGTVGVMTVNAALEFAKEKSALKKKIMMK
ncbi:MAG: EscU/YscU/HrcU family type III secretion system export apparatus switch protein, partial [Rhodospirillales bacterium]|nr:EscU/YscU/HrcU family type III secretion system export apparatus switch protein [Rhodospirillales bacterium]